MSSSESSVEHDSFNMPSASLTNSGQDYDVSISCLSHERQHTLDDVDCRKECNLKLFPNKRSGSRSLREFFDCANESYRFKPLNGLEFKMTTYLHSDTLEEHQFVQID
jgi:hypothetical protein